MAILPVVSVCVCTYKRPGLLSMLIESLGQQTGFGELFEIVVIDNDRDGSGLHIVEKWRKEIDVPIVYAIEPEQSITMARNRSVAMAKSDLLAFIDDDEVVSPCWLKNLHETLDNNSADGVFGPVIPVYSNETPTWIARGGFFDRPRHITGRAVPVGQTRTGNALVRREILQKVQGPFEQEYGRTGGEDSFLFDGLLLQGAKFVWCDEAIVSEVVPLSRATSRWLLQRAFRGGQTFVLHQIRRHGLLAGWRWAIRGFVALPVVLIFTLASLPLGRGRMLKWLRKAVAAAGKISAVTKYRHLEYRG